MKYIDWRKTGKNLLLLRQDNLELRRTVCHLIRYDEANCSGECDNCRFDMDSSISRKELARAFDVSENVIFNWENGNTPVSLEYMLYYCEISGKDLKDIVVFDDRR